MWPFTRRYIGRVEGMSDVYVHGLDNPPAIKHGEWILTDGPLWGRHAKLIGDPGDSQHAVKRRAQVAAWVMGGPVPPSLNQPEPDPETKHKAPVLKRVPGGKDK